MRQTNNAITFLSASYQAVFKHAYFAGLASSAVMLTLASPYAVASVDAQWGEPQDGNLAAAKSPSNITFGVGQSALEAAQPSDSTNDVVYHSGDVLSLTSGTPTYTSNNYFNRLEINVSPASPQFPPQEGLTLYVGNKTQDLEFFAKDAIEINNGYLKVSGNGTYLQQVVGAADGNSPITGDLSVSGGKIDLDKAIMTVNDANINNSILQINGGLIGIGGSTTSDLFVNYTSLNTGLGNDVGNTSVERTNLSIGNEGAFNSVGSVSFSGGTIDFKGNNSANTINRSLGEIAAKAIFNVKSGTLNGTAITVGTGKTGAIFAENLTLSGKTNITNNGNLQFAGQLSYTKASDDSAITQGYSGSASEYVNTNFASGTLNLNGSGAITNLGVLTFGGNSIKVTSNAGSAPTLTATPTKFVINQNSKVENKNGILNIGEAIDGNMTQAAGIKDGSGTVYNLLAGNFNNNGTLNINPGAEFNVISGSFTNQKARTTTVAANADFNVKSGDVTNTGTFNLSGSSTISSGSVTNNSLGIINISSGGSLAVQGGTFNNSGSVNISGTLSLSGDTTFTQDANSKLNLTGGTLSVDAKVIANEEPSKFYDYSTQSLKTQGDLSNLSKLTISGGKIQLNNGVFDLGASNANDEQSLADKILSALTSGKKNGVSFAFKNAIVKTDADLNNISSNNLNLASITGDKDSILYTSNNLTFKTVSSLSKQQEKLNNFAVIGGKNVTIQDGDTNTEGLTLSGSAPTSSSSYTKKLMATSSLSTIGTTPLQLQNFGLKLSNEQMLASVDSAVPNPDFSNASGAVNADLNLDSGANLEVEAGKWTAQGISALGNALITINGQVTGNDNLPISTSAALELNGHDLSLNDEASAEITNSGSLSAQNITLSGSSKLTVNNSGSVTAQQSLNLSGGSLLNVTNGSLKASQGTNISGENAVATLTLSQATAELGNVNLAASGSLSATDSTLTLQDVTISGASNASFTNTDVNLGQLTLNASDADHGLILTDSAFKAAGNVTINQGKLSVNNNEETKDFTVAGTLKVATTQANANARVDLTNVNALVGALSIGLHTTNESGLYLTNSSLTSSGDVTVDQGRLVVNNSANELEPYAFNVSGSLTANRQANLQFTNTQLQVKGPIRLTSGNTTLSLTNSDLSTLGNVTTSGSITISQGSLNLSGTEAILDINGASGSLSVSDGDLTAKHINVTDGSLETNKAKINTSTLKGSGNGSMVFTNTTLTLSGDSNSGSLDITGDITLNGGELMLGDAADTLALTYAADNGFTIAGNTEPSIESGFSPIKTNQGAVVSLDLSNVKGIVVIPEDSQEDGASNLATNSTLTIGQANALANQLITGNGLVRFEGQVQANIESTKDNLGRDVVKYTDLAGLDLDFSTDATRKSVLTNVNNSGSVTGEWKAIETDTNTQNFNIGSGDQAGTLSILGTTGNNNLAQNSSGKTVGVNLNSGSALNLNLSSGTGNIGSIVESGNNDLSALTSTLNLSGASQINITNANGSDSQVKVGSLHNSGTALSVHTLETKQASFTSGSLSANNVTIQDALQANQATFNIESDFSGGSLSGSSNTVNAANITFGDLTGDKNNIQASQDLNLGNVLANSSNFKAQNLSGDSFSGAGNNITATTVELGNTDLINSKVTATTITTADANFTSGTQISATSFTGNELNLDASTMALTGDLTAQGKVQVIGGSTLTAQNLKLGSGDMIVGVEDTALASNSSTGKVVLQNLDLNGQDLLLDPEFGQATATLFVNNIGNLNDVNSGRYNTQINGNIIIGRNSALGLGGTEDEFNAAIAKYQDASTHSFKPDDIGALLYVNRANIQLGNNKLLIGTDDIADLKQKAQDQGSATIYLGTNSGLQVTARALNEAKATTTGQVFTDLDSSDVIESTDGTLILPAGVTMNDLTSIFGKDVTLAEGSTIKVTTENGLFHGEINSTDDLTGNGDFSFTVDKNARDILSDVSTPTFNYYMNAIANSGLVATPDSSTADSTTDSSDNSSDEALGNEDVENGTGENGAVENGNETKTTLLATAATTQDPNGSGAAPLPQAGSGYTFLSQAGSEKSGRAIEQSARLASFGMSMQIANQAGKTTSNAINQRLNMYSDQGVKSDQSVITNGHTAVWFSPIYQDFSSSGFDADDLNYGADFDLYGAAVGVDYTFNNGLKFGGVFNFGQGDADGKGIASGVQNDFSYYGLGAFASFKPLPNLTLSADASYTWVDNDIETNANVTDYNKITGSMDSDALSLGVNAQYELQALGCNVTPHAGLRYTHLTVDSYDIKADGNKIGQTSSDSANVFSIPVGVAISTEFKANDWLIKPRADFTVTANLGDNDAGSHTTFDGAVGSANYNTEFMDSVTYGVDAGLQISKGNFSMGANVGYTGSSNTNELTVGANFNYKF